MATRTAIIDLGSNSVRMAIFEKSSRYGFSILNEHKIKLRLCDNFDGIISDAAMDTAIEALRYFKEQGLHQGVRKFYAIGTSALRDASNKALFKSRAAKEVGINVKVISGEQEAALGALAAYNLILESPQETDALCVDIGGGSCELVRIKDSKITALASLNLGTVRLKAMSEKAAAAAIKSEFAKISPDFKAECIYAIGGSLRAIAAALIDKNSYPLHQVHNFSYELGRERSYLEKLQSAKNLADFGIKKDRHDTIKHALNIFLHLIDLVKAKRVISSGVGIREGVFLSDVLGFYLRGEIRLSSLPQGTNPSLRSLQDKFLPSKNSANADAANAVKLFNALLPLHKLECSTNSLRTAAKLWHIGERLSYYRCNEHSAYMALSGLLYGISHEDKALVSTLIYLKGRKFNYYDLPLKKLLPGELSLAWLGFILSVCMALNEDFSNESYEFSLNERKLLISRKKGFSARSKLELSLRPLLESNLNRLYCPRELEIELL